MRYCEYTEITNIKNDEGKVIETQKSRCGSAVGLREVEFKHPDYRDQRKTIILCTTHYLEAFGDYEDAKKTLLRNYMNEKYRFYRDFNKAKKVGEYFNEFDYKKKYYKKVDEAYKKYQDHTRNNCCYDLCDTPLDSVNKVYPILIYKPNGRMSHKLEYCGVGHWEKIKYRVGLLQPRNPNQRKAVSLTEFMK
ncbi:MAG: hypothetical protein GTN97_07130 [Nitrosopumilaceae archaeon]|nr:hypothetical protein [Nitrosopumilaceae archaeon]